MDVLANSERSPFISTVDECGVLCYFVQMRNVIEKFIYGGYNISIQSDHFKFMEENLMRNTAGTTQEMRRKENHKCSKTMAVILGLIVTLEVMIAGGMIFNIDFHSADIITLIFGAGVVFSAAVAVLTDN